MLLPPSLLHTDSILTLNPLRSEVGSLVMMVATTGKPPAP